VTGRLGSRPRATDCALAPEQWNHDRSETLMFTRLLGCFSFRNGRPGENYCVCDDLD
jgi:hypothetical protein